MVELKLSAFSIIEQQDGKTWTLGYRPRGETGWALHIISEAYAKRLLAILQGTTDEGGFTIPYLSQKIYDAQTIGANLTRAVRSQNLGPLVDADNRAAAATAAREAVQRGNVREAAKVELAENASQRARERLTAIIRAAVDEL